MEAILHIGTPKTGTSSIQKFLSDGEAILARSGILYPMAGRDAGKRRRHRGLALSVLPIDRPATAVDRRLGLESTEERERFRKNFHESFDAEMKRAAGHRVVISDEGLYLFLSTRERVIDLRNFLGRHFDRVRIVAYVRAPISFVESSYSQHLKMGGTQDIREYAARIGPALSYWKKLSVWRDVFGADSISVREFARPLLVSEDVVHDFCKSFLDIDIPSAQGDEAPTVNQSISPIGQHLLLRINRHFAALNEPRPEFYRAYVSRKFAGPGQRLTAEEANALSAAVSSEVARLSADFFEGREIFVTSDPAKALAVETPSQAAVAEAATEMSAAASKSQKTAKRRAV